MTENLNEKTNKSVDNNCIDAGTVATKKVATPDMHNDAGLKTQNMSDDGKIDANKSASDLEIAVHDAGSKMNKATI